MKALLGILLLALISTGSVAAETRHVLVIVNTLIGERFLEDPDYFEAYQFSRLEKQFPGAQRLSIRGSSNSEINQKLAQNLDNNTLIDALLIIAHGQSSLEPGQREKDEKQVFLNYLYLRNLSDQFIVVLNSFETVASAFEPTFGKFSPQAKIIFFSCKLLEAGTLDQKFEIMKKVARFFQLNSGFLFMLKEGGHPGHDDKLRQTFSAQPTWFEKTTSFFMNQVIDPFLVPYYLDKKLAHYNHGYTLKIWSLDPPREEMYEDEFFHTEEFSEPLGTELVMADL